MKKSSVRLSAMSVSVLFIIGFAVLFFFASEWYSNSVKLEKLAYKERILHNDMEHLEVVGKWTLDYVKIEKALTYMLGDRVSEVSFRMLAENLWQISQSYSLDPLIVLAVVVQESRGNPLARGRFQTGKFSGREALVAYNLGHTAVDKLLEKNAPLPTSYYEGVVRRYKDLVAHCSY